MTVVREAKIFAHAAHAAIGQTRKYTGEPYIVHPEAVVQLLRQVGAHDTLLAAAWLHDVVEDTQVTNDMIRKFFGSRVAQYVMEVTDVSKPEDGNRAVRKAMDREHLAKASPAGQTLKLADMICNLIDISNQDPDFAKVYVREMTQLLENLQSGNKFLFDSAINLLANYYKENDYALPSL